MSYTATRMASLEQHKGDCVRWLGSECEQVNRWMDEYFAIHGASHRKFRHHKDGIEDAKRLFGDIGAAAALIHVLRDCRHVPSAQDYAAGIVDALGLRKEWPIAACTLYAEEAFTALVQHELHGPTGMLPRLGLKPGQISC